MTKNSTVLALTITDGPISGPATRVLLVVRDPLTNRTHPDVISVPTVRIPNSLCTAIVEHSKPEGVHGATQLYNGNEVNSEGVSSHDEVIFAVKMVMATKLGCSEAIEMTEMSFQAGLRAAANGHVQHSNISPPFAETIVMVNIHVIVSKGADLFPVRTASYSRLFWVPISVFIDAVQHRDPALVGLDAVEFCIRGLCISTAYDMISHRLAFAPYSALWQMHIDA